MKTVRVPVWPGSEVIFPGQLAVSQESEAGHAAVSAVCHREHCLALALPARRAGMPEVASIGTLVEFIDGGRLFPHDVGHVLLGRARCRLVSLHKDAPFLEATVTLWPWSDRPEPSPQLITQVGQYLRRYIAAFSELMPPALMPDVLDYGVATLGVVAAAALPLPAQEKLYLLMLETANELLRAVLRHLRLQVPLAERLASMSPVWSERFPLGVLN